jgi:hypothetical protein
VEEIEVVVEIVEEVGIVDEEVVEVEVDSVVEVIEGEEAERPVLPAGGEVVIGAVMGEKREKIDLTNHINLIVQYFCGHRHKNSRIRFIRNV